MKQVVEVPVVQTLRDSEGELIQESHWLNRWKGYINTYRRQKVGLGALQLYVAVIHTYGGCCPHHLFKWCRVNVSVRNKHTLFLAPCHCLYSNTWLEFCSHPTRLYPDVIWPWIFFFNIISYINARQRCMHNPFTGYKDVPALNTCERAQYKAHYLFKDVVWHHFALK